MASIANFYIKLNIFMEDFERNNINNKQRLLLSNGVIIGGDE